jgi:hypothetical protein
MAKPKKFVVGGLLNIGYGAATALVSNAQRLKSLRELAQLDTAEQGNIMSMAARNRVARQESDAQSAIDAAGRATATQLSAAQEAGGSRAVQSISPQVVRASEEANARALQQFGNVGAQLSNQEDQNALLASQGRIGEQRSALQRSADMATQNMTQGIGLAAAGAAETIGGLAKPKKDTKPARAEDGARRKTIASLNSTQGERNVIGQNLSNLQEQLDEEPVPLLTPSALSKTPAQQLREMNPMYLFNRGLLGKVPTQKEGGMIDGSKALKTPGDFSHKSNPIDVMKDGKKIAEMTGGEYIFNPKQSQKLRNLSEEGTSTLHKFVRELLSKSQFK